mgnify:CR=1 FL=1
MLDFDENLEKSSFFLLISQLSYLFRDFGAQISKKKSKILYIFVKKITLLWVSGTTRQGRTLFSHGSAKLPCRHPFTIPRERKYDND